MVHLKVTNLYCPGRIFWGYPEEDNSLFLNIIFKRLLKGILYSQVNRGRYRDSPTQAQPPPCQHLPIEWYTFYNWWSCKSHIIITQCQCFTLEFTLAVVHSMWLNIQWHVPTMMVSYIVFQLPGEVLCEPPVHPSPPTSQALAATDLSTVSNLSFSWISYSWKHSI